MKLLIDANLSPRVADGLRLAGYQAVHVIEIGLVTATDDRILLHALHQGSVVVTADSDFAMLLAIRGSVSPSVVQLRYVAELGVEAQIALLLASLPDILDDLAAGAIASLSPNRLSVRELPVR